MKLSLLCLLAFGCDPQIIYVTGTSSAVVPCENASPDMAVAPADLATHASDSGTDDPDYTGACVYPCIQRATGNHPAGVNDVLIPCGAAQSLSFPSPTTVGSTVFIAAWTFNKASLDGCGDENGAYPLVHQALRDDGQGPGWMWLYAKVQGAPAGTITCLTHAEPGNGVWSFAAVEFANVGALDQVVDGPMTAHGFAYGGVVSWAGGPRFLLSQMHGLSYSPLLVPSDDWIEAVRLMHVGSNWASIVYKVADASPEQAVWHSGQIIGGKFDPMQTWAFTASYLLAP